MSDERLIIEPAKRLIALPLMAFLVVGTVAVVALMRDHWTSAANREVSFQGEGKVVVKPDVALIHLGVVTSRASNAAEALRLNTEKANRITAKVKELGVADKDVRTSNFNLNPSYDYMEGRHVLRGFDATTELEVKIRALDKIGDIISGVTSVGANQVGGLDFTVDDIEAVRNQAREKAITAAREKAKFMARASGLRLGKLINISESSYGGLPIYKTYGLESFGAAPMAAGNAPDIQAGSQEIAVNVNLTYRVK